MGLQDISLNTGFMRTLLLFQHVKDVRALLLASVVSDEKSQIGVSPLFFLSGCFQHFFPYP